MCHALSTLSFLDRSPIHKSLEKSIIKSIYFIHSVFLLIDEMRYIAVFVAVVGFSLSDAMPFNGKPTITVWFNRENELYS